MSQRPFRPHVRGINWYQQRVAGLLSVHQAGMPEAIAIVRHHHPRFAGASVEEIRQAALSEDDARLILAREHGFEDWPAFRSHIEAIESGAIIEPFTLAFDAIQADDAAGLGELLKQHGDLASAQGTNGSSLLNLATSFRQVEMCRMLLDAGADPDQPTTRGVTPLHAAAYSNQPLLIDLFLKADASIDLFAYGDGGTPLAMALFWGHDEARQALAPRGMTPRNLRTAAGVGRIDLIEACFEPDGALTAAAGAHRGFYRPHTGFPVWSPSCQRQEILDEAMTYAARNGQLDAMNPLKRMGADVNGDPYRGTPLIWAATTGRVDIIQWLLANGADVNCRATFGGPTHGQGYTALHAAAESGRVVIAQLLLGHGADRAIRDALHNATPEGWAGYRGNVEMEKFLRNITA